MKIKGKPIYSVVRLFLMGMFSIIFLLPGNSAFSQIGGDETYQFLGLIPSARIAAVGGKMLPVRDNDLNLVFGNPALLNAAMDKQFSFSHVKYYADIDFGHVGFASRLGEGQTMLFGVHYMGYGDFTERDVTGVEIGRIKASEYSFNVSYARDILDSSFSVGATLKTIYSNFADYKSFGMAADVGLNYYFHKSLLDLSLVVKNFGYQLKGYREGEKERLPLDLQFGISKRLSKAPFRFSLVLHQLQNGDITYKDPAKDGKLDPLTGEPVEVKITTGDKILRHVVFGTELLLSKNFHIRAGYNFQRRKELSVETKKSTIGLSYGLGLRLSRFHFSYGRAAYHLAGPSNHFTISTYFNGPGPERKKSRNSKSEKRYK
jgi:hypothetical protein